MDILAKKLKEERIKRGWTLGYVATRLGLKNHSTYSNWEYGNRDPDSDMLKRLAQLYEVSTDYLLGVQEFKEMDSDDLENLLRSKKLTWGNEELNEEEKERAIEILKLFLDRKKGTS